MLDLVKCNFCRINQSCDMAYKGRGPTCSFDTKDIKLKDEISLLVERAKQCACAHDIGSVKGLLEEIGAMLSTASDNKQSPGMFTPQEFYNEARRLFGTDLNQGEYMLVVGLYHFVEMFSIKKCNCNKH